ncbi:MAG: hypothetical protein WEB00_15200 [Dehalococcoidia bacterium]
MADDSPTDVPPPEPGTPMGWQELLLYVVVGAAYIAIGIFFEILLFSWLTGTLFMLAGVWLVPMLVRRLRS